MKLYIIILDKIFATLKKKGVIVMGIVLNADEHNSATARKLQQEEIVAQSNEAEQSIPIEHELKDVYIPEAEMKYLREAYSKSVVQDFEDIYHFSKSERERYMEEHRKIFELNQSRFKVNKLSTYIKKWRMCMDIINDIARHQCVFTVEEFTIKTLRKEITISGLTFPKYIGKDKKTINWDFVAQYMVDLSKDPDELDVLFAPQSFIEDENSEIRPMPIVQEIMDNPEKFDDDENADLSEEEFKARRVKELSKKEVKRLTKFNPDIAKSAKEIKKRIIQKHKVTTGRYEDNILEEDFGIIKNKDRKRMQATAYPKFKGCILDDDDFEDYMRECEEWERENTLYEYNGKYRTADEIDEIELKQTLEKAGWDLRKAFVDKSAKEKEKKRKKREKKKEKEIKNLLANIKKKKSKHDKEIDALPSAINPKERKFKGKKKKKKSKSSKKGMKQFESLLLDASNNKRYKNFKAYEKSMNKMSWDYDKNKKKGKD